VPGVTTSTIKVTGSGKVFDLNVELDITHTYHGQLTSTLFAPDGTPVEFFSNVGGSGDNFTATVLYDAAATSITAGSTPFTGTLNRWSIEIATYGSPGRARHHGRPHLGPGATTEAELGYSSQTES
jgi:subtilisin-like proprotein convertase family protein